MRRLFISLYLGVLLVCAPACSTPSSGGVVAADHPLASAAGAEVLRKGGNAVDAAVATSLALSVVRPNSCGIGGGGFMLIHLQDDPRFGTRDIALNYRETCPRAIDPSSYEDWDDPAASRDGGKAVAIPGTVAGLLHALEKYGTLNREAVFSPAIRIAETGWTADEHHARIAEPVREMFDSNPAYADRFPMVWDTLIHQGRIKAGDQLRNPDQAAALRLIVEHGKSAFYEGSIADAITSSVQNDGGVLSMQDLREYQPEELIPIRIPWRGSTLLVMPPPSSGGIAIGQIFSLVDRLDIQLSQRELPDAENAHLLIETMKHAFADRARHLADPNFADVPIDEMLSNAHLDRVADLIDPRKTGSPSQYGVVPKIPIDGGTSHFSVVDRNGNAVACTETINTLFGSLLGVNDFGFCLNNQMDDFTTIPGKANIYGLTQSNANLPQPGKRPLSSMSPTIVLDEHGSVFAVAGASGGPRIITSTLQVLLRVMLANADAADAITAPRLHHQWSPNAVYTETWNGPLNEPSILDGLERAGHETRQRRDIGHSQIIRRSASGDHWDAACDPRKGGLPVWE